MTKSIAASNELDEFLDLSRDLTGVSELDRQLGSEYLERVREHAEGKNLALLLETFRALPPDPAARAVAIAEHIMASATVGLLAQQVTLVWYTSAFDVGGKWSFGSPGQHFSALMWPIIGAHPLGLSGGYFGYWKYPPET